MANEVQKKEVIRHNVVKKMIADLKLDEKQAADFRKVEAEFREKMEAERKQAEFGSSENATKE